MKIENLRNRKFNFDLLTENEKIIYVSEIIKKQSIELLTNYKNNLNELIKNEEIRYYCGRLAKECRKISTISTSICLYLEFEFIETIINFYNLNKKLTT